MTASFPHWTQTVSTGTKASTVFRTIITNYALIQSNLRKTMLPYESMEGLIKSFSVTNQSISGLLSHEDIVRTASQHHKKLHATSHITATDMIPLATSTANGLMSTTIFNKQKTISSNANSRRINVSNYIGNGNFTPPWVSKSITLGWRPRYIKIFQQNTNAGLPLHAIFEKIDGNAMVIKHKVSTLAHQAIAGSMLVINNTGFKVYNSCNVTYWKHIYLAME